MPYSKRLFSSHQDHTLESFSTLKILCALPIHTLSTTTPNTNPTTTPLISSPSPWFCLFKNVIYIWYPEVCHLFRLPSFSESYAYLKCCPHIPSPLWFPDLFLELNNTPWCSCSPGYVSIHLLKDGHPSVVSKFWQL